MGWWETKRRYVVEWTALQTTGNLFYQVLLLSRIKYIIIIIPQFFINLFHDVLPEKSRPH
jgi:hypothetical protein